jgi:hypothetical protein
MNIYSPTLNTEQKTDAEHPSKRRRHTVTLVYIRNPNKATKLHTCHSQYLHQGCTRISRWTLQATGRAPAERQTMVHHNLLITVSHSRQHQKQQQRHTNTSTPHMHSAPFA